MSTEPAAAPGRDASTELSSHRTALSLERTLMSADRTQMSVLRTSLSLIGFGFTIYKIFEEWDKVGGRASLTHPARNLGMGLVALSIALLVAGLVSRYLTMRGLARRREALFEEGLLKSRATYPTSPNMVISFLLLIGALLVLLGIAGHVGPFA